MKSFTIESQGRQANISIRFEAGDGRLICLEESSSLPDAIVPSFRCEEDIYYRSPTGLSPDELAEEVSIHIPESMREVPKGRIAPSAFGTLVLMQYVHPAFPAISPLTALAEILRADADVNFGILQADNGNLLFARRAGNDFEGYASTHSLKTFFELPRDEREAHFPGFHADEVVVSGGDLDHFEDIDLGPMEITRRITLEDLRTGCEFTEASQKMIERAPHLYTVAIGAARAFGLIGGWL